MSSQPVPNANNAAAQPGVGKVNNDQRILPEVFYTDEPNKYLAISGYEDNYDDNPCIFVIPRLLLKEYPEDATPVIQIIESTRVSKDRASQYVTLPVHLRSLPVRLVSRIHMVDAEASLGKDQPTKIPFSIRVSPCDIVAETTDKQVIFAVATNGTEGNTCSYVLMESAVLHDGLSILNATNLEKANAEWFFRGRAESMTAADVRGLEGYLRRHEEYDGTNEVVRVVAIDDVY